MSTDDLHSNHPLDQALAVMLAEPEDDEARLRYYRVLAESELFVLLEAEAERGSMSPLTFPLESGPVVLAFSSEERLVAFTGMASPYAALPGRVIAAQLAGQGLGLGVNLGSGADWLMADYAVDWLAGLLGSVPSETRGLPVSMEGPGEVDPRVAEALAVALSGAGGLAAGAVLARAEWADGSEGLLLAYLGASEASEPALARALAEAIAFSGLEEGLLDVVFLEPEDATARHLLAIGQPLRLPEPPKAVPERAPPPPPGMDPAKPPRLR